MQRTPFYFRRTPQIEALVSGLTAEGESDFRRGVFVFSPPKTGKTTFLREGLAPTLRDSGWEPVLVEMFPEADTDPRERLETTIVDALRACDAMIETPMGAYRMGRPDGEQATLQDDANWTLLPPDVSLVEALSTLQMTLGRPLVLMIDDAQHLLSASSGLRALEALQLARDKLVDLQGRYGLSVVFAINSLERLRQFTSDSEIPFHDCPVGPSPAFPAEGFSQAFTDHINARLMPDNRFSAREVMRVFELVGRRPDLLWKVVRRVGLDAGRAPELGVMLDQGLGVLPREERFMTRETYQSLPSLQRSILLSMSQAIYRGSRIEPWSEGNRVRLARMTGVDSVDDDALEQAIADLVERGFVWHAQEANRYGLESAVIAEWARHDTINKAAAVEALWDRYIHLGQMDEVSRDLLGSIDAPLPIGRPFGH